MKIGMLCRIIQPDEWAHFGTKFNFYCFPIAAVLKFLKVKCNLTNKNRPLVLAHLANTPDFMMKSGGFHAKDLHTGYLACNNVCHESGRFHGHEIQQISWLGGIRRFHGHEIWWISWNPADFMQGLIYTAYLACNRLIHVYLYWFWWKIQHSVVDHEISAYLMYICIGSEEKSTIHEIQWISWNLVDFMQWTYAVYKM